MNWNRFGSNLCLIIASSITSVIAYNELILKPTAQYIQETGKSIPFVYYPSITFLILIILFFILIAIALEEKNEKEK